MPPEPYGLDAVPPERWLSPSSRGTGHGHVVEYGNHLVECTDEELVVEHNYARANAGEALGLKHDANFKFWQARHHACDYLVGYRHIWGLVGDE